MKFLRLMSTALLVFASSAYAGDWAEYERIGVLLNGKYDTCESRVYKADGKIQSAEIPQRKRTYSISCRNNNSYKNFTAQYEFCSLISSEGHGVEHHDCTMNYNEPDDWFGMEVSASTNTINNATASCTWICKKKN